MFNQPKEACLKDIIYNCDAQQGGSIQGSHPAAPGLILRTTEIYLEALLCQRVVQLYETHST